MPPKKNSWELKRDTQEKITITPIENPNIKIKKTAIAPRIHPLIMNLKDTTFLLQAICRIKDFYGQTEISELCASDLLIENLGLDSLQIAELSVLIEAEYGFDVFADGMLPTVGDLLSKIELNQQDNETAG